MELGFLSIIPPVLTIVMALVTKNVFISLIMGLIVGNTIINNGNVIASLTTSIDNLVDVFQSRSNVKIIFAMLLIGALMHVVEKSGGINGFVRYMTGKAGLVKSKRAANLFTWLIGIVVFTSGTLSVLITGAIGRPISKSMKVSPEKTAFIVHSTGTPWSVILPLGAWGPYMIGLLEAQKVSNPTSTMIHAIPLNFYCVLSVFAVLTIVILDKDFFKGMKQAEALSLELHSNLAEDDDLENINTFNKGKSRYLIAPIVIMITSIISFMFISGHGNITKGDGYGSLLWGVLLAITISGMIYLKDKVFSFSDFIDELFIGIGHIIPVTSILVLAFALGALVSTLGTGAVVAGLFSKILSPALLAALLFIMTCIISFATGTSVGTMAVMVPIGVSMALALGANVTLVAAAIFGGSVFGDNCSPISDSTILTCSTTDCDVVSHVKTQIPYTLTFGAISTVLYAVLGIMM